MLIERATVVSYANGKAVVQCVAKRGCGGCASNGQCGTQALSALSGEKQAPRFELAVPYPLNGGDQVEIGLTERNLLIGVFWLYVVPLCVLMGLALCLSMWIEQEWLVACGALFGTWLTFRQINITLSSTLTEEFIPVFVRKLP